MLWLRNQLQKPAAGPGSKARFKGRGWLRWHAYVNHCVLGYIIISKGCDTNRDYVIVSQAQDLRHVLKGEIAARMAAVACLS